MDTFVNTLALSVPQNLNLTEDHREVIIEKKWFSITHLGTLLFAIAWCSFTYFFYQMMIEGNVSIFILLFPILHIMVGIWLLYYAVCGFFNKTVIKANNKEVSIRHTPLPWNNDKIIARQYIQQLFVKERIQTSKATRICTYDVQVILQGNIKISLVKGLETAVEARFIEKKLEHFLKIEDRPVKGSYTQEI